MGYSAQIAILLVICMLDFFLGTVANPTAPYGLRSKCYKIVSKITEVLAKTAFCKSGPPSELRVCAINVAFFLLGMYDKFRDSVLPHVRVVSDGADVVGSGVHQGTAAVPSHELLQTVVPNHPVTAGLCSFGNI